MSSYIKIYNTMQRCNEKTTLSCSQLPSAECGAFIYMVAVSVLAAQQAAPQGVLRTT